jgi:hypothetical protein
LADGTVLDVTSDPACRELLARALADSDVDDDDKSVVSVASSRRGRRLRSKQSEESIPSAAEAAGAGEGRPDASPAATSADPMSATTSTTTESTEVREWTGGVAVDSTARAVDSTTGSVVTGVAAAAAEEAAAAAAAGSAANVSADANQGDAAAAAVATQDEAAPLPREGPEGEAEGETSSIMTSKVATSAGTPVVAASSTVVSGSETEAAQSFFSGHLFHRAGEPLPKDRSGALRGHTPPQPSPGIASLAEPAATTAPEPTAITALAAPDGMAPDGMAPMAAAKVSVPASPPSSSSSSSSSSEMTVASAKAVASVPSVVKTTLLTGLPSVAPPASVAPEALAGYLLKKGYFFPLFEPWKRRYFYLDRGLVRFFEHCGSSGGADAEPGAAEKGQFSLRE